MSYVKLFVGNLPWSVDDAELEQLFGSHGEVQSARVITDRDTGRSRGFGFVEMETSDVASVISATNGQEIDGRAIRVNEAEERDRGGFGGGGGGGGRRDSRGRQRWWWRRRWTRPLLRATSSNFNPSPFSSSSTGRRCRTSGRVRGDGWNEVTRTSAKAR